MQASGRCVNKLAHQEQVSTMIKKSLTVTSITNCSL